MAVANSLLATTRADESVQNTKKLVMFAVMAPTIDMPKLWDPTKKKT